MPDSVEIVRNDVSTGPTYHFSNYKQLLKALEANGYNEKWGTKDVPETFAQITLSEQELKDLVKRLNQAQTCFEQQNLLRIITMNKLKSELGSITFRNTEELKTAIEQRGVDYPKKYLHQSAESEIIKGFSAHRTLSTPQWEKLITDLKGVNESDPMLDQKRGEIIIAAFGLSSVVPRTGGTQAESGKVGPQKILVEDFYPSRDEATKKALEGATGFPITVQYSEGGKSYEYQIQTSGNTIRFGEKEITFAYKGEKPISSIKIVDNNIVFSAADNSQVMAIDKRTFGNRVAPDILSSKESKLELFGKIGLGLSGGVKPKNIPTPQTEKELSGDELRNYILTLARTELESVSGNIEQLTPEGLEQVIQAFTGLADMKWLERFPGLKEKARELLKFDTTMEGVLGAGFIRALETNGYKIGFIGKGRVGVEHVKKNPNARDIETKINMHLSKNPTFSRMLQVGMIYKSPSFESYRQSVTDANGDLINPGKTDIQNYLDYLRRKGGTMSQNDLLFLHTSRFFDKELNFASIVSHGKDYNKIVELMGEMNPNEDVRRFIANPTQRNGNGGGGEAPAGGGNTPNRGGSNGAVSEVGKGIGKLGGLIGKLGEAGIGGGMKVLGELFQEANKAGGAYGTLAVIGLIGYSIFGKKGLGFWGTIAAFFGLGVADAAASGGLQGIAGGGNGSPGSRPAAAPSVDPSGAAPAAAAAPGATSGDGRTQETAPAASDKPLSESSFIARAVGRENIHDADVESEKVVINAIKKINFDKLQAAISKGDEASWRTAIDSTGFKRGSAEYTALAQAISVKNEFGRKTLLAIVEHIKNNDHFKALEPANRVGLSLEQAMEYIIKKENEKKQDDANGTFDVERPAGSPPIPPGHPSVRDILKNNEAYGNLVILTRMVEYGYLPKINFTAEEVKGGSSFIQRFVRGFVWVGTGGPLSNNVPGANWFSGKYRVHEENFYNAVKNLVNEEKAILKKEVPSLPDEAVFQSMRDEVTARNTALTELEEALSSKDPARIKSALTKYREVAKTPFYKGRIDKEKFALSERQSIAAIETVNTRIQEEFNSWKQAQDIANTETATAEQKKAALDAANKYNQSVMELEAHGVKNLQLLSPEAREVVMKENPWAARVASANGGITKMNEKLGKVGSHWAGKTILGVGLLGLIWESKGGVAELWKKGDYATLSKMGWDLVAGAVPVVSSLHETAMLSNAGGYRDFILGKGYEMGTLEKGFRVAGAIPLGLALTTVGGKLALKAGARTAGQAIIGVSEIVGSSVKTIGTVGTFGFLGYQAVHVAYNIPMHLIDKK